MLNIVVLIPDATLLAIRDRRPTVVNGKTVPPVGKPLPEAAVNMLRDYVKSSFIHSTDGSAYSMQAASLHDIAVMTKEFPDITVLGVWHMDTGLQAGLYYEVDNSGLEPVTTVLGTPIYPFNEALWLKHQPLKVKTDDAGKVISSKPYLTPQQITLWAGQVERIFT